MNFWNKFNVEKTITFTSVVFFKESHHAMSVIINIGLKFVMVFGYRKQKGSRISIKMYALSVVTLALINDSPLKI